MASTYSPILKIQLIGTGEQSGQWGATTNYNLGTLLEQAIAGVVEFSVTAGNVTLTSLDGTSDQARCMALRVTGSAGVSRNVIAPTVSKLYVVFNDSDANVVLKATASTGLTIPSGETYLAFYDSSAGVTDFRFVGHSFTNTNVAKTLVLRDASGNFAASFITAGLIGNVLGDVTGNVTGNVSGNVSGNVTGNINGTVGATTPAAGAFTTLSASGNTTMTNTLTVNASVGTAGQSLLSRGAGLSPQWGASFVTGMIMMWSGSIVSIPTGWLICDGTNSTPDLRNKFIVGAGSTYAVNATGGSADLVVPSHTHTATDSGHIHSVTIPSGRFQPQANGQNQTNPYYDASVNTATGFANITVSTTGVSPTNANLPPYLALAYIMKS
jgi:microcystin-dependent protein